MEDDRKNEMIQNMKNAIFDGEVYAAPEITQEAINEGISAEILREEAIGEGIAELEEKLYGKSKVYGHPRLFMGMEAARRSLEVLKPRLKPNEHLGTVVMGTPQGDVHDVGGKMVAIALTAAGFKVFYLGRDVPLDLFIYKVRERQADILAISSYHTSGFSRIEKIVELMKTEQMRDRVDVMVGGVSINGKYAHKLGILYAATASGAAKLAKKCIGEK